MQFRQDINGLRAIAVTAVLLFHFHIDAFRSGFVGVDIFYVISGFLMTQIITRGISRGSFSIRSFYMARVRRIVPALVIMCAAVVVVGLMAVDPASLKGISSEVVFADTFTSNLIYAKQSGYFDTTPDQKWLLHTWSTSLEWQFYLTYPLALALAERLKLPQRVLVASVWIVAALSFLAAIVGSLFYANQAFYILPCRIWEMAAGSLVAFHGATVIRRWPGLRWRTVAHYLGLLLIFASIFFTSRRAAWPGVATLAPVLGAALVILAEREKERWADNPVVAALGRWSYSIYIWHWPVVAALAYYRVPMTPVVITVGLLGVILVSALSYRFIETAFTAQRPPARRTAVAWGLTAGWVATIAAAGAVWAASGIPSRHGLDPQLVQRQAAASGDWSFPSDCGWSLRRQRVKGCAVGGTGRHILVMGDSHAEMLYPLAQALVQDGRSGPVTFLATGGCPPLLGVTNANIRCAPFTADSFRQAESGHFDRVIVAANWVDYFNPHDVVDGRSVPGASRICPLERPDCTAPLSVEDRTRILKTLFDRLAVLKASGSDVVLVLPFPIIAYDVPRELIRREYFHAADADIRTISLSDWRSRSSPITAQLKAMAQAVGARTIDPSDYLCTDAGCATTTPDGTPYMMDSNHVRRTAITGAHYAFLDQLFETPATRPT